MSTYCDYAIGHPIHGPYHDREYGFPLKSDNRLFERLVLEINQAGLSWETVLKKRKGFQRAYDHFDIDTVAGYGARDRARLLRDPAIIRNKLKVSAAIENARQIIELRNEFGSFSGWLRSHHPRDKAEWVKLFKTNFKFTGGEIVGEFLMSTGYLPGAHKETCPTFAKILTLSPPWLTNHH
ncbi:MAG: DNA-3-methyladenine glycosylase I [Deltaproteobacteria bacterium]|nr:DNA-3-methyladenine glycosylase I [Deltaproteobacteria bacterium]